jgi:hypothetical protein
MVGRSAGAELLNRLNTLTHVGVAANLSDAQLLARFLARGGPPAEAAFEALVARHGPMVLDVYFRILRDSYEAQDAFQATRANRTSPSDVAQAGQDPAYLRDGSTRDEPLEQTSCFHPAVGLRSS